MGTFWANWWTQSGVPSRNTTRVGYLPALADEMAPLDLLIQGVPGYGQNGAGAPGFGHFFFLSFTRLRDPHGRKYCKLVTALIPTGAVRTRSFIGASGRCLWGRVPSLLEIPTSLFKMLHRWWLLLLRSWLAQQWRHFQPQLTLQPQRAALISGGSAYEYHALLCVNGQSSRSLIGQE